MVCHHKIISKKDYALDNSVLPFVLCSVMTPYYSEETVYSRNDLDLENEDGVSIIFYLQKIFPGSFPVGYAFDAYSSLRL
jgi:hypothetical protein